MIRTRELVVFMVTALLLVGAIAVTWVSDVSGEGTQSATVSLGKVEDPVEVAVSDATSDTVQSVNDRLAAMRERVQAFRSAGGIDSAQFVLADRVAAEAQVEEERATSSAAQEAGAVERCADYTTFTGVWPSGVRVDEREGARLVYTVGVAETVAVGTSTMPAEEVENILLQLPVHTTPRAGGNCVRSDVVGVAQDGSLIRNHEHGLYSVFTDETTVGYALDGFPIFGRNDSREVDECGGAEVRGVYGYVLQSDRDAVLQCFRGQPVRL